MYGGTRQVVCVLASVLALAWRVACLAWWGDSARPGFTIAFCVSVALVLAYTLTTAITFSPLPWKPRRRAALTPGLALAVVAVWTVSMTNGLGLLDPPADPNWHVRGG